MTPLTLPSETADAQKVLRSAYATYPGMAQIIVEFVNDLPGQVQMLRGQLQRQELEPLRRHLHQLRGACGGYGFEPITQLAAAAEDAIRAGRTVQEISTCIESLIEMIQKVEGYNQIKLRSAA